MAGKILLFLLGPLLLFGCSSSVPKFPDAGGKLSLCLESTYITTEPSEIGDYYSQMILGQVMEGLVALDPTELVPQPQLAKSYEIKNKGLVYEFTLREGVLFHDFGQSYNERKLTPEDVVYSIEKACSKSVSDIPSNAYSLVYQNTLKGADDFFEGKSKTISGVSVKGNVIRLELVREDHNFLHKLALISCSVISKKSEKSEKGVVGTGPFVLAFDNSSSEKVVLQRNEEYYMVDKQGFSLPYLDSLEFLIDTKKMHQLDLFEEGQTDLIIGLPTSRISRMLEGRIADFNSEPPLFVLYNNPQLISNYYFFNLTDTRFQDKRVRQAFNYAIDKEKLGSDILANQYYEMGFYGLVPPIQKLFRGYDFESIRKKGYQYNPELAQKLLKEAGYPDGEGFGSVELRFNIDDVHSGIADAFSRQIKQVLNININVDATTFSQLTKDSDATKGALFKMTWSADYPSPETFLMNFYGKTVPKSIHEPSYVNQSRFQNTQFDALIDQAKSNEKMAERMKLFCQADALLLEEAPFVPLWYNGEIQIVYSRVRNLRFNPIDLFIFKEVYKKEWTQKEYLEHMKK